ncbi:LytTR family DNA-binding domain-containing protein [Emticicia sp. C21]|uniref:LytR/AlgR family response regulator transcription factor n=1 Tax=Emticicia sp. C21 TaxID=2302915 RepID=UPI000E349302|nr:LytTR family DNA-binding domain-containing protein [Emticicia sp. C21]RFS14127.1 DNA-binding response regulator [Emticicia sp. C21]
MLQAIAIDDEPIALEIIKNMAAQVSFIDLSASFTNAIEALDYMQTHKVDAIFLDIKMPGISGLELVKSLPQAPIIIFTTAYSEHAVQSFELNAIDYLLKPFSFTRFLQACNKAHEQVTLKSNYQSSSLALPSIFIKSGYEQIKVDLEELLYAESTGNYVKFFLANQTIVSRLTMSEVEVLLPLSAFIRIHRSFIVAKKKITKIDKRSVWVLQKELPVGSFYSNAVEQYVAQNSKT